MSMRQFYINGIGSGTYGVYISSDTFLNSPAFDFTEYNVPARNGNLIAYNKRLNNVVRRFDCFIKENVSSNLNALKKLLYANPGYVRIESDYDPDTYQEGYLAQEIEVTPFDASGSLSVQFSIFFSCKPQKYLKTTTQVTVPSYWNVIRLLPRNSKKISTMLNLLDPTLIPDDMLFYAIRFSNSVTNLSASWSGGADFFALIESYYEPYTKTESVITANMTSLSGVSGSVASGRYLWAVFGFRDSGSIVYSNSTTAEQTIDLTSGSVAITNANATGVTLDKVNVTMQTSVDTSTYPSYITMQRVLNGETVATALLTINNSAGAWNDYYYRDGDNLRVDLEFDLDLLECHAVKEGLAPLNIGSIVNIEGNIDGVCDSIIVHNIYADGYIHIVQSVIEPKWWKL